MAARDRAAAPEDSAESELDQGGFGAERGLFLLAGTEQACHEDTEGIAQHWWVLWPRSQGPVNRAPFFQMS
jgi:hypothetical protein